MGSRLGRRVIHFANLPIKLLMPSPSFDRIREIVLKTIPSASKIEIRRILESLYGFDVEEVRTLNMEGKKKKRGGFLSAAPDYKKAYVTLCHPLSLNPDLFPVRIVQEEREKIAQASASRPAVVEDSGKRSHWLDDPDRGLDRRDLPHGPKKGRSGVRRWPIETGKKVEKESCSRAQQLGITCIAGYASGAAVKNRGLRELMCST